MDDEILALALQLEELGVSETETDISLAQRSYQQELTERLSFVSDLKLANDIAQVSHTDSDVDFKITAAQADNECYKHLAKDLKDNKAMEQVECAVCNNLYYTHNIIELPCHHLYCRSCLGDLFLRATKDEPLFPPKCCRKDIPFHLVQNLLLTTQTEAFELAAVEFTTQGHRTYCHEPTCGRFIPPDHIDMELSKADCTACGVATCSIGNHAYHTGDCPADAALQATMDLAAGEGWRRCDGCRAMVELTHGCNHIT